MGSSSASGMQGDPPPGLKYYLVPGGRVHAVFADPVRALASGGSYYEGFGTPRGMSRACIEPLLLRAASLAECEEIGAREARRLHPELFGHIEARLRGGVFYTRIEAKDIAAGMTILIGQGWHRVSEVLPGDPPLVKYAPGGLVLFGREERVVRCRPTGE